MWLSSERGELASNIAACQWYDSLSEGNECARSCQISLHRLMSNWFMYVTVKEVDGVAFNPINDTNDHDPNPSLHLSIIDASGGLWCSGRGQICSLSYYSCVLLYGWLMASWDKWPWSKWGTSYNSLNKGIKSDVVIGLHQRLVDRLNPHLYLALHSDLRVMWMWLGLVEGKWEGSNAVLNL